MSKQTTVKNGESALTREALEKRRKSLVGSAFLCNGRHGKYDQCVLERGQ